MEMTARLTADAKVSTLKNDRQVVNFSLANDSYKAKGSTEITKMVTYVQCDYWVNPNIAPYLTKGTLVELHGRIGVNAYKTNDGEAKATLTFHVNTIELHGNSKQQVDEVHKIVPMAISEIKEPADDPPF
jgi:single-strand DNA-binding protein